MAKRPIPTFEAPPGYTERERHFLDAIVRLRHDLLLMPFMFSGQEPTPEQDEHLAHFAATLMSRSFPDVDFQVEWLDAQELPPGFEGPPFPG